MMFRFSKFAILTSLFILSGCGKGGPTSPENYDIQVQFVSAAESFHSAEDLSATLANRSSGTVYVAPWCLPELERFDGAHWAPVVLTTRLGCTDEVRLPMPVKSGASLEVVLARQTLTSALPPGTYRFVLHLGKANDCCRDLRWSNAFSIVN